MSNEALMTQSGIEDPHFNAMTGPAYLPRLELFTSSKKAVKSGIVPVNHWVLTQSKDRFTVLKKQIPVRVLAYRYLALDFSDLRKVINNYDPTTDEFKRIAMVADTKAPEGELNPCMAGVQFLLALEGNVFATFHAASKSNKAIAGQLRKAMDNNVFVQLDSFFKTSGPYSWQAPEVKDYPGVFDISIGTANAEISKFRNASSFTADELGEEPAPVPAEGSRAF